jgi:hypothetical protein
MWRQMRVLKSKNHRGGACLKALSSMSDVCLVWDLSHVYDPNHFPGGRLFTVNDKKE